MKVSKSGPIEKDKEVARLRDYRLELGGEGLRGLGIMGCNVDNLVANRMKKKGMI